MKRYTVGVREGSGGPRAGVAVSRTPLVAAENVNPVSPGDSTLLCSVLVFRCQ